MELHRLRLSESPRRLDITIDGGGINKTPKMKGQITSRCLRVTFPGLYLWLLRKSDFFRSSYFGVVSQEPNVSGINRDALVCLCKCLI